MLSIWRFFAIFAVFFSLSSAHDFYGDNSCLDDIDLDWEHGSILISEKHNYSDIVEINSKAELFINNQHITLTEDQRVLTRQYHELAYELKHQARDIGIMGARIGAAAGSMAVKAVVGALGSIFDDDDDWEDDLEQRYEKRVDRMGDKIEDMAEELEETVEGLEDTHLEMKKSIPELDDLNWF